MVVRAYNAKSVCQMCGKEFDTWSWELKRGRGKYCSSTCKGRAGNNARLAATNFQMGKDNPNWKNGRSNNNYYYRKRQKELHPLETSVRDQTYFKIRSGKIVKQPCEVCGTLENVEAHHDDYSKPDDIRWLCRDHHRELHRILSASTKLGAKQLIILTLKGDRPYED